MADDKRNRDDQQSGNQGQDQQRRDRKPGSGTMEPPERDRTRKEEREEQE